MAKYCSNCGTEILESASFCVKCGKKLSSKNNSDEMNTLMKNEETWYKKGCELVKQGRLEEASECFDNALKINPTATFILALKGQVLHDLGRYEEAIPYCDKTLEIDQNHAGAWLVKGNLFEGLGRHKEAISCYDRVLELSPDYAKEAYYNKGNAQRELRRFEEAISCYDHALEIDQKIPDFWQNKGLALEELERFKEAISCYDHALEMNPKNPEIWNDKGNSLAGLGLLEEALSCYDAALEINPNLILALNNKSIALNSLGKFQEAIACCDLTLKINSKDTKAWYFKGCTLYSLRRSEEARKCLSLVIELDSESELASEAGKMIKEKDEEVPVSDTNKESEVIANILNLCESDPDAGLEFIEKSIKENPELESSALGKFAKAMAYGGEGLFQLARSKSEIDFFAFDQEELRDDLGITDGHLDYLEKALQEIKEMEELHPGFLQLLGTKEDRIGELKVDSMALVLERCRPGRVQQILGQTKLKYFGPRRFVYIDQLVNISWGKEKASQEEFQNFSDIFFSFPSTVRMASIMDYGRGSDGRKYIHCLFYRRTRDDPAPGESIGEMYITVGNLYFFNDRTFGNNPPGEYIEQQKEEPVREKQPSKKGFFRKII